METVIKEDFPPDDPSKFVVLQVRHRTRIRLDSFRHRVAEAMFDAHEAFGLGTMIELLLDRHEAAEMRDFQLTRAWIQDRLRNYPKRGRPKNKVRPVMDDSFNSKFDPNRKSIIMEDPKKEDSDEV